MRNRAKSTKTPEQLREQLIDAGVAYSITREATSLEALVAASLELGRALEDTAKTAARCPLIPEAA